MIVGCSVVYFKALHNLCLTLCTKEFSMRLHNYLFSFALLVLCLYAVPALGQEPAADPATPAAQEAATPAPDAASSNPARPALTQGSQSAVFTLPKVNVYGVADQPPTVPVVTRFGTQFNVVSEDQIRIQNSLDFYDALRNVPGVMFQKKNIIGGQTGASLYMRGRGAGHPSPDLNILFDDVPRSGVLYGQALADGIPVYALGGMEIYKSPQPARFGSGYGIINFIPKYMSEEGTEIRFGLEGGSYGTFAQHAAAGAKKGIFDIYAAQSFITTEGHVKNSAAQQYSYYLNTGVQLGENWSVRLMTNYVDAWTEGPYNPLTKAPDTDEYDTTTSLTTLTLAHEYAMASGFLKAYYNDTDFSMIDEGGTKGNFSEQSNTLYGLRGREALRLWQGSEIILGFDLDRTELRNYSFRKNLAAPTPANPRVRTWDFPDQTLFSPYLGLSQYLGEEEGFHAVPSGALRYFSHSVFDDIWSWQAGLVLGYAHTDLAFNYSRGVNYPSPVIFQGMLMNRSLPAGFDTQKIKPEVVDHYEVSLTHSWPTIATLSGTFFYDEGKNRFRAFMGGTFPSESYFLSSAPSYTIKGMELTGSLTPTESLEFFAGGTWLDASATDENGKRFNTMPFTPSFAFQAGFRWMFLDGFRLSADYQHMQNVYSATSSRPLATYTEMTRHYKLPDINVVNLRLDYTFDYEPIHLKEGNIFFAINNLFDQKYGYAVATEPASPTIANPATRSALYEMPGINFMVGMDFKF